MGNKKGTAMNITQDKYEEMQQKIASLLLDKEKLTNSIETYRMSLEEQARVYKVASEEQATKLKDAKSNAEYHSKLYLDRATELEQIHSVLDVFPGALPRESDDKESYRRTTYTAMTRLASWLAGRGVAPQVIKNTNG